MTDKLKPCPFCGGTAKVKAKKLTGTFRKGLIRQAINDAWFVRCEKCHSKTAHYQREDSCINAWQAGLIYQR